MAGIYAEWAPIYKERGFEPRPIKLGTKACYLSGWQDPMSDEVFARSLETYGHCGIGLLMGTTFSDGTKLGVIDVDDDRFVRPVADALGMPTVSRLGSKGMAYFVRTIGQPSRGSANPEFRVKGDEYKSLGKVVECLLFNKLCVLPPTIHPKMGTPYRWIGPSLLDVTFDQLPILDLSQ